MKKILNNEFYPQYLDYPNSSKPIDGVWYNVNKKLPPVDDECIVLDKNGKISFGHIVDSEIAIDYDGWNIPDVVFWVLFSPTKEMNDYYEQ